MGPDDLAVRLRTGRINRQRRNHHTDRRGSLAVPTTASLPNLPPSERVMADEIDDDYYSHGHERRELVATRLKRRNDGDKFFNCLGGSAVEENERNKGNSCGNQFLNPHGDLLDKGGLPR